MKEKKSQQIRMRPSKDCVLYSACCGFAAGVLWRSFWHVSPLTSIIIGATYLLLTLLSQLILKNNWNICISVFVISLIIGIARFQIADIQPPQSLEKEADKTASFTALIVDEPAKSQDKVKLIVEASLATTSTKGRPGFVTAQTGMVIFSKEDQGFQYGDQIKVTGKLEKPANFMTDQDMEFDYVNYLRKDGIFYTMHDPKIAIISRGHGNPVKRSLFSIKSRFDAALSKAVPTPESTVLGGIILGERYGFSESLRQIFMDTGTIHIVTIGGYHVTLVAKWIMAIFGFLPRFAGIGAGVAGIFLYVIATGGAQTSIRAGIMATLALIAGATRRRYDVGRALILAATVMIIINPFVLAYDVSFELSFIATIAIIFLSPLIMPYFEWIPWKWLRDIVAITSSMYVFALPFVLYRIGNLSLVSLPANILIVPLMPLSMIAGFVTGFAGMVAPAFAILPGKIAYALLYFQISSVGTLARLPFAAVTIPGFSLVIIIAVYSIFVWIFIKTKVKGETTNDTPHN
ncbi:MAG: ComEC/Rec2 family competence protein, partial [Candidatus Pacebacteria bacterium]|nr:ComEC/Rec2 family competence protein [Candidatus Paceibacterota bacterium]